jgi:hypothetical protein
MITEKSNFFSFDNLTLKLIKIIHFSDCLILVDLIMNQWAFVDRMVCAIARLAFSLANFCFTAE